MAGRTAPAAAAAVVATGWATTLLPVAACRCLELSACLCPKESRQHLLRCTAEIANGKGFQCPGPAQMNTELGVPRPDEMLKLGMHPLNIPASWCSEFASLMKIV